MVRHSGTYVLRSVGMLKVKRSFNSDRVGRVYPCIEQYRYCIVASIVRTERRLEVLDTTNLVLYSTAVFFFKTRNRFLGCQLRKCTLKVGLRASWEGADGYDCLPVLIVTLKIFETP